MTTTHTSSHRPSRRARGRWAAAFLGLALGGCDSFDLDSLTGGRFEDVLAIANNPQANIVPIADEWSAAALLAMTACNGNSHGTVGVNANGKLQQVSDQPADRIVLQGATKPTAFVIHGMQLTDNSSVNAALSSNRDLRYALIFDGHRVEVVDWENDDGALLQLKGSAQLVEGSFMDVDLRIAKGSQSEVDNTGAGLQTNRSATGTIKGAGVDANIRQIWKFELQHYDGDTAHYSNRLNSSRLRMGGDTYTWEGVRIKTVFYNGRPRHVSWEWIAEGKIKKNGGDWGKFKLDAREAAAAVVLETPSGDLVLERYHLQGDMAVCRNGDECISGVCVDRKCRPRS